MFKYLHQISCKQNLFVGYEKSKNLDIWNCHINFRLCEKGVNTKVDIFITKL